MNIDLMNLLCKWGMKGKGHFIKWLINVVIKLFAVLIVGLFIIAVGTVTVGVDANAIFSDVSIWKVTKNYFQHMPHIGMLAESMLPLIEAATIKVSAMETSIYEEILRCCIYMMIVRCFDTTLKVFAKIFERFMTIGIITAKLADITVYGLSYMYAIGIADIMYDGVTSRVPVNIACWMMAGILISISVVLVVIQRKTMLVSFLKLVGGGLIDVFQLVLIYSGMMCITIINNETSAGYISGGEQALITVCAFVLIALFSISFIRRLLER